MKSAIPWVLVAALLAGVYFLYSANNDKAQQLARQAAQIAELDQLRAENAELKKIPVQAEELERLRKDNLDLIRLRAEVQQLRTQNKDLNTQLATALAKNAQAQQAQQQLASENQALRQPQEAQSAQPRRAIGQEQINACITNLRQIDGAKQAWALETKASPDAIPTAADLTPYFPPNAQFVCPNGGTYTINAVNLPATCSVPGHVLSK